MKILCTLTVILVLFSFSDAYSKYGRTCKDIGCRSSEVCVMESDPCSYRQREGECGAYPTCKKSSSNAKPSCSTYICPPTKVCKMDGETPKCVDDHSKRSSHVGYDTQASGPGGTQGQSSNSGGSLYPTIPQNNQNVNPNVNKQQPAPQGGGAYPQGYPGYQQPGQQRPGQQPGQYPGYQGGYQGYPGYQQPGYQQPGYQQPGYQQPGYQQPGYQPGGYQPGYQQPGHPQGGYPNQYPQGQKNSGSSFISDTLQQSLKTIGTDLLKNAFNKLLQNNLGGQTGTNTNPHRNK